MCIARTMMLHSAIHWPDVADACLWPMAVRHATFLHNHMPDESTGISPHDIFTRSRWEQRKFHYLHVWGCPVYCLEKAMHDGNKLPRWKPRSHRTMNMGLSAKHASTVPLVLNLDSGYINSQFNIVFDDWFATVVASVDSMPDLNLPEWDQMFGDSSFQFPLDPDDEQNTVDLNKDATEAMLRSHNAVSRSMNKYRPDTPLIIPPVAEETPPSALPTPLVETVADELPPPRSPPSPLIYPIERPPLSSPSRELPSSSRELPSASREPSPAPPKASPPRESHDDGWTQVVSRPQREKTAVQQNVQTPPIRRSSRSNKGQGPDRLINRAIHQPYGYLVD
jgi:hypothetical protein